MKTKTSHKAEDFQINPNDVRGTATTVVAISIGSAFFILVIAAATCYLYRRRLNDQQNHKTFLLKRNSGEKVLTFRKSSAIKSPNSGTGPTLKKSPSPTGAKTPPGHIEKNAHESKSLPNEQIQEKENKDVTIKMEDINPLKDLELKLEPNEIDNDCDGKTVKLGKLHFKLKYNYEKKALCVSIIKCTDLPSKDANNGSSDPYVKLQLLPEKQHKVKTRVLRKTQNPVYDEDFTFYGINPNQLQETTLHFVVLSFDRYSRDDVIGEILCQLNHIEFDTLEKQIFLTKNILPRNHKIRLQGRGEILMSLCYQPAANRLTAVVLKARNLPKMDITGLSDPYVKFYLYYNNQRIVKKRTHVKKRTLNPVYNESFVFDVPYKEGLENVSLVIQVLDYDRVTKNEVIGKIEMGSKAKGSAQKHWNDVIASPRKQIAEWHKLLP